MVLRKRLAVLVAAVMTPVSMLAISGPASAQGCKDFGTTLAAEGQAGMLRENVRNMAPANDEVHFFQGALCD